LRLQDREIGPIPQREPRGFANHTRKTMLGEIMSRILQFYDKFHDNNKVSSPLLKVAPIAYQ
jgi:hypothetical protein